MYTYVLHCLSPLIPLSQAIMTVEFETCKEIESYLRGNSFITKLLSGYTKYVKVIFLVSHSQPFFNRRQSGRLHLSQALKESITAVVKDLDLDLEMDPAKVRYYVFTDVFAYILFSYRNKL